MERFYLGRPVRDLSRGWGEVVIFRDSHVVKGGGIRKGRDSRGVDMQMWMAPRRFTLEQDCGV